jgi:osmotically-inducible protein OsmY
MTRPLFHVTFQETIMVDDTHVKQDVLAELDWEPGVNAAHVGVTANSGVVTLSGYVKSLPEKKAAEQAAGRVKGVRALVEEIEVRLPSDLKLDDDEIAAAAVNRLAWDSSLPDGVITIKVEKGWVTLSGEVERHHQREAAERDVRGLSGVVGITNHTTIKPLINAANIRDDISHALHRIWFFNPKTISVAAEGGKVLLTGTAHSLHERNVAEATAWAAPGAIAVENRITIV